MMLAVFGNFRQTSLVAAAVALGVASCTSNSLAADPPAKSNQDSVKIEPYTGPPIYLEEVEQIAAPTVVTRESLKEKYDDGAMRVEREVAHYSDNNFAADGAYREFHPNGKPFIEGKFKSGRQDGEWAYYFDNGQVNRKAIYADGKPNGSWEIFRADGTLSAKRSFKEGTRDGEWITYDATGKLPLAEEHYVKGDEDGTWKVWYANGKLKQQAGFKLGKREGMTTEWDENGKKLLEAQFTGGKFNGTVTRYFADGKSIVQKYKDGKFESEAKQ